MKKRLTNNNIITLIGSVSLKEHFFNLAQKLSLEGNIVLMPLVYSSADGISLTQEQLDKLYQESISKIAMADEIIVINDGRIGETTTKEIMESIKYKKPISYYNTKENAIHKKNNLINMNELSNVIETEPKETIQSLIAIIELLISGKSKLYKYRIEVNDGTYVFFTSRKVSLCTINGGKSDKIIMDKGSDMRGTRINPTTKTTQLDKIMKSKLRNCYVNICNLNLVNAEEEIILDIRNK